MNEEDLFAYEDLSVENLPETGAAGWSTASTLASASSVGSTISSASTLSSYNS